MKVVVDIPDNVAMYLKLSTLEKQLRLFTALILVRKESISISRGAELAGMTIYDFLKECKDNDIPVIDYSREELKEEFENLKKELL